jgi:hypothetical protein
MIEFRSVREASRMYDVLYELGQEVLDKYDPCNSCTTYCCNGCKYVSPKGCTVKCLRCKLWLCSEASSAKALNEMRKLERIGYVFGLMDMRTSKRERMRLIRKYAKDPKYEEQKWSYQS